MPGAGLCLGLKKEMSAEELDKTCRTSIHVNVNDTAILAEVLNGMGAEYRLYSPNEADIFTPMQVTPLVLALNEKNCFVNSMTVFFIFSFAVAG